MLNDSLTYAQAVFAVLAAEFLRAERNFKRLGRGTATRYTAVVPAVNAWDFLPADWFDLHADIVAINQTHIIPVEDIKRKRIKNYISRLY